MDEWDARLREALAEPCPLPGGLRRGMALAAARQRRQPRRAPLLALLSLSVTAGLLEVMLVGALIPHPLAALPVIGYGMTTLAVGLGAAVYWLVPGLRTAGEE